MKLATLLISLASAFLLVLAIGCDKPEMTYPADSGFGSARAGDFGGMSVDQIVAQKGQARSAYLASLGALRDYYMRHGYYDNQRKAEKELSDVGAMKVYRPMAAAGPTFDIANASEIDLVERTVAARSDYYHCLQALNNAVKAGGDKDQVKAVSRELDGLQFARRYPHLLLVDLPGPDQTRPVEQNGKADELYRIAQDYFEHLKLPWMYSARNMRMALEYFNRVIREYPQSDKVDDALFYGGEILKEYFNEDNMAVEYYRRAYLADPDTPHPVRFQRAVVLDYRLHRRDEALKEYRAVLEAPAEKHYLGNTNFAIRRIRQLTQP